MTAVGNAWDSLDESCWSMIIDSNKGKESVTNHEIIDESIDRRAEYVIPKDYIGQANRTLESLIEFEQLIDDRDSFKAKPIPIIQYNEQTGESHANHLKNNKQFYQSYSHLAIGGLQNFNSIETIKIIRDIRRIIGPHTNLHGFGVGTDLELIQALRYNPNLLDSLDMSTSERMPYNNHIPEGGLSLKQTDPDIPMPNGDLISVVNAQYAKANLLKINYFLSDQLDKEKFNNTIQQAFTDAKIEKIIKAAALDPEHIKWEELSYNPRASDSRTPAHTANLASFG